MGELRVYRSSRRPSIRLCVCVFTLSNNNISETNGSIANKFYLKHHSVGGKAALGFGPDRIRTLFSMATKSSHMVTKEKNGVSTFSRLIFFQSFLYLQIMKTCIRVETSSNLGPLGPPTAETSEKKKPMGL